MAIIFFFFFVSKGLSDRVQNLVNDMNAPKGRGCPEVQTHPSSSSWNSCRVRWLRYEWSRSAGLWARAAAGETQRGREWGQGTRRDCDETEGTGQRSREGVRDRRREPRRLGGRFGAGRGRRRGSSRGAWARRRKTSRAPARRGGVRASAVQVRAGPVIRALRRPSLRSVLRSPSLRGRGGPREEGNMAVEGGRERGWPRPAGATCLSAVSGAAVGGGRPPLAVRNSDATSGLRPRRGSFYDRTNSSLSLLPRLYWDAAHEPVCARVKLKRSLRLNISWFDPLARSSSLSGHSDPTRSRSEINFKIIKQIVPKKKRNANVS